MGQEREATMSTIMGTDRSWCEAMSLEFNALDAVLSSMSFPSGVDVSNLTARSAILSTAILEALRIFQIKI